MTNGTNYTYAGILLVTVLGLAGTASASPITFDEFPVGTLVSNQYADDGVLFLPGTVTSRLPQIAADDPVWMPTQPFLRPTGEPGYNSFQGDFWMEFVSPVSRVEFLTGSWDYAGAGIIQVYDPGMNLLGSFSNTRAGPETISIVSLAPIGKIYFNSIGDWTGAGIDDLSFTAIPAPGALLLVGLGAGVVGWLRSKRALV